MFLPNSDCIGSPFLKSVTLNAVFTLAEIDFLLLPFVLRLICIATSESPPSRHYVEREYPPVHKAFLMLSILLTAAKAFCYTCCIIPLEYIGAIRVTALLLLRKKWLESILQIFLVHFIVYILNLVLMISLVYPLALAVLSAFDLYYGWQQIPYLHKKNLKTNSMFLRSSCLERNYKLSTMEERENFLNEIRLCPLPKGSVLDILLLRIGNACAMTLIKTIYIEEDHWNLCKVKSNKMQALLTHEVCHCIQFYSNIGASIGFLSVYGAQYFSCFIRTWNMETAYLCCEAEKEAFAMELKKPYFPPY